MTFLRSLCHFVRLSCRLILQLKLPPTPAICILKFTLRDWYSHDTNEVAKLHAKTLGRSNPRERAVGKSLGLLLEIFTAPQLHQNECLDSCNNRNLYFSVLVDRQPSLISAVMVPRAEVRPLPVDSMTPYFWNTLHGGDWRSYLNDVCQSIRSFPFIHGSPAQ